MEDIAKEQQETLKQLENLNYEAIKKYSALHKFSEYQKNQKIELNNNQENSEKPEEEDSGFDANIKTILVTRLVARKDFCSGKIDNPHSIPLTNNFFFNDYVSFTVSVLLISILITYKIIQYQFLVSSKQEKIRLGALCVLAFISIVGDITWITIKYKVLISDFVRPFFFIMYNRELRQATHMYLTIIYKSTSIIIFWLINIIIFACLGRVAFQGKALEYQFENFFDGFFHLLVCFSSANFPDIMIPGYEENRATFLFYWFFMIFNTIMISNMMIGIFFLHYKDYLENRTKQLWNNTNKQLKINQINFQKRLIQQVVRRKTFNKKIVAKQIDNYIQELRKKKKKNQDNDVENDLEEQLLEEKQNQKTDKDIEVQPEKKKEKKKENISQIFYKQQNIFSQVIKKIKRLLSNNMFRLCLGVFTGVPFIVTIYYGKVLTDHDFEVYYNQIIYIFVLNLLLSIYDYILLFFLGWKEFKKDLIVNAYEITSSTLANVFYIIFLFEKKSDGFINIKFINIMLLLRCTRLVYHLLLIKQLNFVVKSFFAFFPFLSDIGAMLIFLFYFFAALGMHIFGGKITNDVAEHQYPNVPADYIYLNFNDFASSLVVLWSNLMVNNWEFVTMQFIGITNVYTARFFFIFFYYFSVLLGLSICVGLTIEFLLSQWQVEQANEVSSIPLSQDALIDRNSERLAKQALGYLQSKDNQPLEEFLLEQKNLNEQEEENQNSQEKKQPHGLEIEMSEQK